MNDLQIKYPQFLLNKFHLKEASSQMEQHNFKILIY